MRGAKRIAAVAAVLAVVAAVVPAAGADTTWTKVSTDYAGNNVVPSLALSGPGAVLAWAQRTGPNTTDLNTLTFTTTPTADVIGGVNVPVIQGWSLIDARPALFAAPGGGLQMVYSGSLSGTPEDPPALFLQPRNPDGTWGAAAVETTSTAGAESWTGALAGGAIPWVVTAGLGAINVFNGAVPVAPDGVPVQNLQPQLGDCCGYQPKLALDTAGQLWIAWYSSAPANTGVFVQQLDPATAAPLGPPAKAPNSESTFNNNFGTALVCAATCRVVYGNQTAGGATNTIVSWWPGQTPVTITDLSATNQSAGRVVTAAYRADGKLWTAWYDGTTYRASLGDATGAGGVSQDAGIPAGSPDGAFGLAGIAVGNNLLLAANYAWKDANDPAPQALFVNTIAPPAPVTKAPGPRDASLQAGPGKTFRIQVQYTLPKACTAATPCTLRGQLGTRSGRRLYAVTPLPGDTKLILGTRKSFAVPKGATGKIRFYIAVSKSQLLKAPFSTEGDSRVAETRLRVWYTAKGSPEALSVRDGRIKVSIERIKSGALPGLAGIL